MYSLLYSACEKDAFLKIYACWYVTDLIGFHLEFQINRPGSSVLLFEWFQFVIIFDLQLKSPNILGGFWAWTPRAISKTSELFSTVMKNTFLSSIEKPILIPKESIS